MASTDLRKLWRLHEVDYALHEIRQRAAALDPGKAISAKIAQVETKLAEAAGELKRLRGEQTDLELEQKGIDEKLKKLDKELYGGSVVNPREVENREKEIAALKRKRGDDDVKLLELMDLIPPAGDAVSKVEKELSALRARLSERRKAALAEKAQLEADYKTWSARRSPALADVPVALISRYDAVRKRLNGVAMAKITKDGRCGMCGTLVPERTLVAAKSDQVAACEECHRLLYYTEGLL